MAKGEKGRRHMISNQILQSTIDGLKRNHACGFMHYRYGGKSSGNYVSGCGQIHWSGSGFVESPADSQVVQGCQFFKVFDEHQLEYILLANGDSDDVFMIGKIASFSGAESFSSI